MGFSLILGGQLRFFRYTVPANESITILGYSLCYIDLNGGASHGLVTVGYGNHKDMSNIINSYGLTIEHPNSSTAVFTSATRMTIVQIQS